VTIILDLPPDVENVLTREAQRQGTTPENLLLGDIQRLYPSTVSAEQRERHNALAEIVNRSKALMPDPVVSEANTLLDDEIVEKFQRQGFHL
jgi:hypothetical protein